MMRKRFRSALVFTLSLILIALCANIPATAVNEDTGFLYPYNLGDVDGDGKITASDARTALRISVGVEKNVTEFMKLAADFDRDSKIMASDARTILRVSVNLEKRPYDQKIFSEALKLYGELMNQGKADKPGFSLINYSDAPSDKENRKLIVDEDMVKFIEAAAGQSIDSLFPDDGGSKITRDEALANKQVVAKGSDMAAFPLFGRDEGAIVTVGISPEVLKSASVTDLANGNKQIKFVLNDETNPKPLPQGNNPYVESFTSAIFAPMTEDLITEGDNNPFKDSTLDYELVLRHFDCTATLEYNPSTKQIVSLKHDVNVSFLINLDFGPGANFGFMQNIFNTYEWFDFAY